jgi:4-hydroxythreonine-4-phosphate dehydrogenase
MGEPAGIGPDVVITALTRKDNAALPTFFVNGDPRLYEERVKLLGVNLSVQTISAPGEAVDAFPHALPVLPLDQSVQGSPSQPSDSDPALIVQSLLRSVEQCLDGTASAMVTAPINKSALYKEGFSYQGHTDFLADRLARHTGAPISELMMLCAPMIEPTLRVVPVTIHTALHNVAKVLNTNDIVTAGLQLHDALQNDFDIETPRIAVAGLNPHAGEQGAMGLEEIEIIAPAIDTLVGNGVQAKGPYPADTLFHAEARAHYDAVLCMYHDQALIPLKTLDFHGGVNATLGLPLVRTSPDHGTAYDLAGSGNARPDSMIAALKLASAIEHVRRKSLA